MPQSLAHIVASWYDPGDNGFDVGDLLTICLVVAALYGGIVAITKAVRWVDARNDRRKALDVKAIMAPELEALRVSIEATIHESTKPIQPETNGGLSMTDLHSKVSQALVAIERIEERLDPARPTT